MHPSKQVLPDVPPVLKLKLWTFIFLLFFALIEKKSLVVLVHRVRFLNMQNAKLNHGQVMSTSIVDIS